MLNHFTINYLIKILRLFAKTIVGVFLFLSPLLSIAQQGAVWTFGLGLGLDFNYTPPKVIYPKINSFGSCATICDSTGKLLLYTDAAQIYNKHYQVIENGDSIKGYNNYGQSCLILQDPNNSKNYFLFSIVPPDSKDEPGLYYTIIDMSNENGKVIQKSKIIHKGIFRYMTAIRHNNMKDIWIITKCYPDSMFAYKFGISGLSLPVKSHFQAPYTIDTFYSYGNMKSSHDGKKLIEVYGTNYRKKVGAAIIRIEFSYINSFDFDKATGQISNKKIIEAYFVDNKKNSFNLHHFNDVAFSPNDSFFYITDMGREYDSVRKAYIGLPIRQYNRYATNISNNFTLLPSYYNSTIQLGPDGKIYVGQLNGVYLSIIHNPNNKGLACRTSYNERRITAGTNPYLSAFPNMLFEYLRADFSFSQSCSNKAAFINKSDTSVFKYFTWHFSGIDSTFSINASYNYTKSGKYLVKLLAETPKGYKQWYSDSILYLKPPQANFSFQSNAGCQWVGFHFKDASVTDTINVVNGEKRYWDFGDGTTDTSRNPVHIYTKSGNYTVRLIYSNGFCSDTFTTTQNITILEAPKPGFSASVTKGCTPLKVELKDKSEGKVVKYFYNFGNGETDTVASPSVVYHKPGIYKIKQELLGETGCITSDSVLINVVQGISPTDAPKLLWASVTAKNAVEVIWNPLFAAEKYLIYRKTENGNADFALIKETNDTFFKDTLINPSQSSFIYKIIAKDSCGNLSNESNIGKTILLKAKNENNKFALLQWTPYEDWQQNGGIAKYIVEVIDSTDNYTELINLSSQTIFIDENFWHKEKQELCYRVRAIATNNSKIQSTSNNICLPYIPQLWIPTAFSPNNDGLNDTFRIVSTGITEIEMQIFNRWGERICTIKNTNDTWDGKYNGEFLPPAEYIYVLKANGTDQQKIYYSGSLQLLR